MTLIKYNKPTEYSFYKWVRSYPDSDQWIERIKKHPELRLSPLIGTNKFYRFVKTACKNRALTWLNLDKIEKIILGEIPSLNQSDLGELKEIFEHLLTFYKTPAIKKGYSIENTNKVKKGYYIEKGFKQGKFYEKKLPTNVPKGGIMVYDKKYRKVF